MKIETLKISNFRGISGTYELEPGTENLVIVGPNGSGKSSAIAAIDFLLTGSIRELSGPGTQSLTERRHAPHVDSEPTDAWVEAKFVANGNALTVKRSVEDRNNPEFQGDADFLKPSFVSMASAADRGLHLLSREEILEFITAKKGDRSKSIRTILDLQTIKDRRLALDNAADHFDNQARRFEREQRATLESLYEEFGSAIESPDTLIDLVNGQREDLGGEPLASLSESFTTGIELPSQQVIASPLLRADGRQRIDTVQGWFETDFESFLEIDEAFRDRWNEIEADKSLLRDLENKRLIDLGIDAIEPSAKRCPLCRRTWDPEELENELSERAEQASHLQEHLDELEEKRDEAQQLLTEIRTTAGSLREIVADVEQLETDPLDSFIASIQEWEDEYDGELLTDPPKHDLSRTVRAELLRPSELREQLEDLTAHIAEGPELEEMEEAWQILQSADNRYETIISQARRAANSRRVATQMETVHEEFIDARDAILGQVYDEIEDRFVEYYAAIHGDETEIEMGLSLTEAGLEMELDFYDRGQYPPHALHSEGHQDSMGLCLYFALFEHLQGQEELSLMMLDDVMMSIDASHRRPLAQMMASELADDHQLFITTHEDLWHRHLRSAGIVQSDNAIQLSGWTLTDGPIEIENPGMEWETVESQLSSGNTSIAAHQTRRMGEWFLREACDRLNGKVPFKADSEWTLGDFQQGVISRYKSLVGQAKDSAHRWDKEERVNHFEKLDDQMTNISRRIARDGAAINPNVHWNEEESAFADCSASELEPALEAYRDLHEALWCGECNSCIRVSQDGNEDIGVRCNCSSIHWNLQK